MLAINHQNTCNLKTDINNIIKFDRLEKVRNDINSCKNSAEKVMKVLNDNSDFKEKFDSLINKFESLVKNDR